MSMDKKRTRSFPFKKILMILSLMLSIIISVVISVVLYNNSRTYINEKMNFINNAKMLQTASELDDSFTQINKIETYMQNSSQLIHLLKSYEKPDTSIFEKVQTLTNITQFLANIRQYNDIIEGIVIITPYKQYDSGNMFFSYGLYKKLILEEYTGIYFRYPKAGLTNQSPVPYESKAIESLDSQTYFEFCLYDDSIFYGKVFIFIKNSIIQKPDNMDCILLLDNFSNVVYKGRLYDSLNLELIKSSIIEDKKSNLQYSDKKSKIYYKNLSFNNWSLLYLVNLDSYVKQINTLLKYAAISFFFSFVISFFFSGFASVRILHPIFKLSSLMKRYRAGKSEAAYFHIPLKKSRLSLQEKFFIYMLITILVPLLVYVSIFYVQSSNIMQDQFSGAFTVLFNRTADNVTTYLNKKQTVLQQIIYNPIVQAQVTKGGANDNSEIADIIEQNIYLGLGRDIFSLYDTNGKLLFSNKFRQKEQLGSNANNAGSSSRKVSWSCPGYAV